MSDTPETDAQPRQFIAQGDGSTEIEIISANFARSLERRLREAEETWTDDKGVTWRPPTAWAYAQVCRVKNELKEKLQAAECRPSTKEPQ